MKKVVLLVILLCIPVVSAQYYTLADYPDMFFDFRDFNAKIVKGSERDGFEIGASNLIINSLPRDYRMIRPTAYGQGYYSIRTTPAEVIRNVIEDTEADLTQYNTILIGTPCHNTKVAEALDIGSCASYFKKDEALVQLVNKHGKNHLVITGYDGTMVLNAAKYYVEHRYIFKFRTLQLKLKKVNQRVMLGDGLLGIGEPIGRETPALFMGYPDYSNYRRYGGTRYGTVYYGDERGTRYYGGRPTRGVNILGSRTYIQIGKGTPRVVLG